MLYVACHTHHSKISLKSRLTKVRINAFGIRKQTTGEVKELRKGMQSSVNKRTTICAQCEPMVT